MLQKFNDLLNDGSTLKTKSSGFIINNTNEYEMD